MAAHLSLMIDDAQPKGGDLLTLGEAGQAIAQFHRDIAARTPHGEIRALMLRSAGRWESIAVREEREEA
jgi:hypothetical protein